jgi:hypothetical protein
MLEEAPGNAQDSSAARVGTQLYEPVVANRQKCATEVALKAVKVEDIDEK